MTAYLIHDKERAKTSERVEWSETHNLLTNDIEKAALIMAWTDKNADFLKQEAEGSAAGAKASAGNVYHFSLAQHPGEEDRTQKQWSKIANEAVNRLGLSDHQYYFVAHNDEPQQHIHIVVNLVNPETGCIHKPSRDFKILDRWANEYEQENGIVCENRAKKYEAWERGEKAFIEPEQSQKAREARYKEQLTQAYKTADSGKAFLHALEEQGLELAWKDTLRGFRYLYSGF